MKSAAITFGHKIGAALAVFAWAQLFTILQILPKESLRLSVASAEYSLGAVAVALTIAAAILLTTPLAFSFAADHGGVVRSDEGGFVERMAIAGYLALVFSVFAFLVAVLSFDVLLCALLLIMNGAFFAFRAKAKKTKRLGRATAEDSAQL